MGFSSQSHRGQAHTLEAIVAALVLMTSVAFTLQMTAVTPLSASTSSQHIENQLQASADGVLATAQTKGELKRALLFWDHEDGAFHNTTGNIYYTQQTAPHEFGARLERAFGDRGIGYNVYVSYYSTGGGQRIDRHIYHGAPSDNAVRSTTTVTLTDGATLYNATGAETNISLNDSTFYAPDYSTGSPLYNVLKVEVVVWRI